MISAVSARESALEAYATIFGADQIARISRAASMVRGARVLHLTTSSTTAHARMVQAVVSLLVSLGVESTLRVVTSDMKDQAVRRAVRRAIDGDPWTEALTRAWRRRAEHWGGGIARGFDFVVVHDPDLVPLRSAASARTRARTRWVWHCDTDLSDCDPTLAQVLKTELEGYSTVAVEDPSFAGQVVAHNCSLIPTAIDPLSGRNVQLPLELREAVLRRLDLDIRKPIVVQVSSFDGWDDPNWAMLTFAAAQRQVPGLQMALVSTSMPSSDDFLAVASRIGGRAVRMLTAAQAGDVEINVLQSAATVAIHQAVRKGYSTSLLEASWKGRPVLAGDMGVLRNQVMDGVNGYLFTSFEDAAQRIAALVEDPLLADALGFEGHRLVRDEHLIVRWVEAYLDQLARAMPVSA